MAFKIHGKDFQAWEEFSLDIEGLTVLIGPSNAGKSSLFRATKGVLRNELGAYSVRNEPGEKLDLTFEMDGHVVNATRTKKGSTVYQVDGKEDKKLNQAIPEDVQALGLSPIEVGGITLDPVFASQSDPFFMLRLGPTDLNAVLGKFSSTERLEQGKREANARIAEKNAAAKALAEQKRQAEELKDRLAALAGRAELIRETLDRLGPKVQTQEEQLAQLAMLIQRRERHERITTALNRIPKISLTRASTLLQMLVAAIDLTEARIRVAMLTRVASRLVIPDMDAVEREVGIVEHASTLATSQQRLELNRRWFEKTDLAVALWRSIVAGYHRKKAIDETTTLLQARTVERNQERAARLANLREEMGAVIDRAESNSQRLIWIERYQTRSAEQSRLTASLTTIRSRLTVAQTAQTMIEQQIAQALVEEREQARIALAAANAQICPHCGIDIHLKPGEDHEHSTQHLPTAVKGRAGHHQSSGRRAAETAA